jgi:hypothetical protein
MRSRCLFLALLLAISAGCLSPSLAANRKGCPVTKPSDRPFVPPPPYKSTVGIGEFLYGTPALWTLIYPGWRVYSGGQKLPYFRQGYDWMKEPAPLLTVVARRLDSMAPLVWNGGYANNAFIEGEGAAGMFMVTGVDIPSSGCWEIAAHYLGGPDGIQTLTYTVWVAPEVKVGSEPSAMEVFSKGQGIRTIWSNEVGRLDHNGTRAVLTALVMEDSSLPSQKVRGVRVDLSRPGFWPVPAHDRIYLDEEATERTRAALEEIADAVASDHSATERGCMGAREFWPPYGWPWIKYHELNAQLCGDSKSSTLELFGRGKREIFQFPGESPASLAAILASAMDQVKRH